MEQPQLCSCGGPRRLGDGRRSEKCGGVRVNNHVVNPENKQTNKQSKRLFCFDDRLASRGEAIVEMEQQLLLSG